MKLIWFLPTAIAVLFLALLGLSLSLTLPAEFSVAGLHKNDLPLAIILLAAIAAIPLYLWVELVYRNFTYELRQSDIIIREGVLTRKTTVIPYVTIQDINSERTVVERLLGLATIEIETAGSSRIASETFIPGIANKDALIAEIMQKVQLAKGEAPSEPSKSEAELLQAILQELKTLSSKMDKLGFSKNNPHIRKKSAFEEYQEFKKKR
ncbi:MAG: PH domain-containing protein [Candidatus Micrarchaeota archaeon]|nr:PH domain-containing protein [Candidatus Micrarchaeota archaeon]